MKATKKIVGAACALVAAVALSAGSTFAWFTTNSHVTAEGMQISVDTASEFLVVKAKGEENYSEATKYTVEDTTGNFNTDTHKLKPSAHDAFSAVADITDATKWYYEIAAANDSATGNGTKNYLGTAAADDISAYVYHDQLNFTMLQSNTNQSTVEGKGLCVTKIEVPAVAGFDNNAITVILACGTNIIEYKYNGSAYAFTANATQTDSTKPLLAETVKSGALTTVDIYVYYDGANAKVYTDNAAKLTGATLKFEFDLIPANVPAPATPTL